MVVLQHRSSRWLCLLASAALVVLGPAPAAAATKLVKMTGYDFEPATTTIARGDAVRWRNDGPFDHDVYATRPSGSFSSGPPEGMAPGDTYLRAFRSAGRFIYVCRVHIGDGMTGTVIVPIAVALIDGDDRFRITVASQASSEPWRHVIQVRKPGASAFTQLVVTRNATWTLTPQKHGTFAFRSAIRNTDSGRQSGWSPVVSRTR